MPNFSLQGGSNIPAWVGGVCVTLIIRLISFPDLSGAELGNVFVFFQQVYKRGLEKQDFTEKCSKLDMTVNNSPIRLAKIYKI